MPEETHDPAWHQALAYAVTGERLDELGRQRQPDVHRLADELGRLAADRGPDLAWSAEAADYLVPADLMEGIGAAQFWAALGELRRALGIAQGGASVVADRPLTAAESRLVADRPPHH